MKKYRILILGENFQIKGTGKKSGFYTTRYVEGNDENTVINIALNSIKDELKNHVERNTQFIPKMHIKEIVELESFEDATVPGSGFSWFEEN